MVNQISINIDNRSGSTQTYAIFTEPPKVIGLTGGMIWSNILAVAKTPYKGHGSFNVFKQYYATCGTSSGTPAEGVVVNVGMENDVDLGYSQSSGAVVLGSSVNLVTDDTMIEFDPTPNANAGNPGSFEIITPRTFTLQDAKDNNYMIGFSTDSGTGKGISASFIPQPNVKYQIQPISKYYIAFGDLKKGQLVNVQMRSVDVLMLDFTSGSSTANIIHDDHGNLVKKI